MYSEKEKEKIVEVTQEDKLIEEKIFSHNHIHIIYILFVNLCKENEYKLTRSILIDLFQKLSPITNIKYEEEKIDLFHLQIDIDKDGIIEFEDFLNFITTILKLTYNELYYKKGVNSLTSFSLSVDRQLFIDIISNLFTNIINYLGNKNTNDISNKNNNINPFTYYDFSVKYLPFYKFYCGYKNDINMNNYCNSQKKFDEFNKMIINYIDANYITGLQNLLNSTNTNEYYKGLSLFKKSIKALKYLDNELLIIIYSNNIFVFLSVIIKANLLNKILMIFNIINNKNNGEQNTSNISPEVIYILLVIIRRILHLYTFLNETFTYCGDTDKKFLSHYIKEHVESFKELTIFVHNKILNPLSNNYDYFYEIFELKKKKKNNTTEAKIKYTMYQLILLTSRLKFEYFAYFINCTNYVDWLVNDVKDNINLDNNNNNNNANNGNGNIIYSDIDNNDYIDYITIENVIFNCINIIDITLRYENNILNNNNQILFINNLYIKLLSIVNSLQDIVFSNNSNNYSLLNKNKINDNINSINNINNYKNNFAIKSKYLCLLGLLNNLSINKYNNINNNNNKDIIQEFDNRKFILQIYNEEFKTKYKELTIPFCFYLKSLIINKQNVLSIITELEIVNNFFSFYTSNQSNKYCTLSSFFDFCDIILRYSDPKILINSNIINEFFLIINNIMFDNTNNNNKLIDDIEIKNKMIELLSKITDLNDICINEKIINIPYIFNVIISYMINDFYYIEEINFINKKGIVFNILLIENGLNIINNILSINSNSFQKIMEHFNSQSLEILANLFDKISLLWDMDEKSNTNLNKEIVKNKYVFDKYKEIPKKNLLIQILLIFDNLSDYKKKFKYTNKNYEQLFDYLNDISINMRIKLRELKINPDGMDNYPMLIIITQSEEEIQEERQSEFTMEIDGISFNKFQNTIKEGYQSDLEISYLITKNNNNIKRTIKTEDDFQVFIQELMTSYKDQPNQDNQIMANLFVKLKEKKPKVKRNCINCQKEIEVELDIDEKKLEEMNDLTNIENINNFNKLINESNQLCKDCEKLILEDAKNRINIENSKNKIINLSGLNMSNLNISDMPINPNNTYQNILASNYRNNVLNNDNSIILSSSLFNRTLNDSLGLNNINNQNRNLFGINNISNIIPTTPRRDNSLFSNNLLNNSNILCSNVAGYKVNRTNIYQ